MSTTTSPLFNRRVLQQAVDAVPEPTAEQAAVAARWAQTVRQPAFLRENEKPHQGAFLSDLFGTVLGYAQLAGAGVDGTYHLIAEAASSETKGGTTPDAQLGTFETGGASATRGVVELKAPGADLDARQNRTGDKRTPVEQGFGYVPKFDGCRWVVVSNFRTVRLYRTTRGEAYAWTLDVGRLDEPDVLRGALAVLGRDRLIGTSAQGESATGALVERSRREEKAVTEEFYRFYRDARVRLFEALVAANPAPMPAAAHERALLGHAQTVLDRLLFVCFAEDTELLPEGVLKQALDQAGSGFVVSTRWDLLRALFAAVDAGRPDLGITGYNGGLFAPDAALDGLTVPDAALDFAYTLSGYDFSDELGVEVLGRVFERSIADLEALHAEIEGAAGPGAEARSKRSQDGVFYTPEWVTRFVAEQALGQWLRGRYDALREAHGVDRISETFHKKRQGAEVAFWSAYRDELRTVKVLDPACGSGAFLVAAFDALLAEYQRANRALAALEGGQAGLFDPDREILRENLYGVDLNGESVEITRLSLWLKTARRGQPLTALDATVRAGNSLVSPPAADASAADRAAFEAFTQAAPNEAVFDWEAAFPEVFSATRPDGRCGFDVVLGNPPYVRGEWLDAGLKGVLAARYAVYAGKADLLSYFYERSLGVMAPGGRLGFIVSNKWLKAGYGEPLRRYLARAAETEALVDFGHSPVFEDADTFPVITVLRKASAGAGAAPDVRLARVPRESLGAAGLAQLVEDEAFAVPAERFGAEPWSLEPPEVQALLDRLQGGFPPLREALGVGTYYGIKTGYNPAFLVDRETRDRLVAADPASAEILKPFAQGSDIARWAPPASGESLVALASSGNRTWPWTGAADPEAVFAATYPSVHAWLTTDQMPNENRRQRLVDRSDQGVHWWELRSCSYYDLFDGPKLMFTDIAWRPEVALDEAGLYLNNSAYFLPTDDAWAVAVLNSPLVWWTAWRTFQHGKDEVLRWYGSAVEGLPFALPTDEQRALAETSVDALVRLAAEERDARRDGLLWLRHEHGIQAPGRTLADPAGMDAETFVTAVRKRGRVLSPSALGALVRAHDEMRSARESRRGAALPLERALAEAVEAAYGLSEAERRLVRQTAPPRTPLYAPDGNL